MPFRKRPRRRFDRPLCDSFGPEDGLDPREWNQEERRPVRNRKAMQLCRQIAEALNLAFAGCGDPLLNDLLVTDVRPFPDSTRVLVTVQSATKTVVEEALTLERLQQAYGFLRTAVAAAIHRRRTPELLFRL